MKAAGNLVRVVVEFSARVQFRHDDFRGGPLLLVIGLYVGRYTAPIVLHADRIIGVDGNGDVIAMSGQRFVNCVIDDFKHHVMQACAVAGIPDIHAGTLLDRFKAFQDLDAVGIVIVTVGGLFLVCHGYRL